MNRLVAAAAALALLLPGCVPKRPPARAAIADMPRDLAHPARNRQLVIPSGPTLAALGRPAEMNALFFLAAGEGPKPTMLLLHGLPGNERNLDLAQAVRRAGWNVLTFTYRGAWGSEGEFSIANAVADTDAAMAFLRTPQAVRTYNIDTRRLVIAGHSMGGFAAALHGANRQAVAGVVLLDAWNAGLTGAELAGKSPEWRRGFEASFDDLGHSLVGATPGTMADELLAHRAEWNLLALAPALARIPVLTLYATHGGADDNKALAAAIIDQSGRVTAKEINSDHAFADSRIALAAEVVRWLQALE